MIGALLAGGPADLYREIRVRLLEQRRIDLMRHWSGELSKFPSVIPAGTALVIILTDFISHAQYDAVLAAAKRAEISTVRTQRKWSFMAKDIDRVLSRM